ncbi:hypothetical protein COO60DRAFT_1488339 [Scenedesmus sp. NREL 46B-D3]|nr:hypothetical protein COO60DRAFT_1488339 [Scenedesmus sp. NREL 46B-D3]
MDAEAKLQQYLLLGKSAKGRSICELITKATAEPSLFTFGELLDLPSVQELQGEFAAFRALLELFCYGTYPEYQQHKASLPPLTQQHELKLKQLTVLPYELLQGALAISTVRDLEDFIISDCFYTGLVAGKLDQRQSCLQVHDVASRDVRPTDTRGLADALGNWWACLSKDLLGRLESEATNASAAAAAATTLRRELDSRQEELKKNLKVEMERSGDAGMLLDDAGGYDMLEDERLLGGATGGPGPASLMNRSKR